MARSKSSRPRPAALIILEGWGVAPANPGNAITEAEPAYFSHLVNHYPSLTLTPGEGVNGSEAAYASLGLGRIAGDAHSAVSEALADKSILASAAFKEIRKRVKAGGRLHLVGMVSLADTAIAWKELDRLFEIFEQLKFPPVLVHAVLDGVDAAQTGGEAALERLEARLATQGGSVASLSGRLYAFDRHGHADRQAKAYRAMALGEGPSASSAREAVVAAYRKKIFDEEFPPTVILDDNGQTPAPIAPGDAILFWNITDLGSRRLWRHFTAAQPDLFVSALFEEGEGLPALVERPPAEGSLGEIFSRNGLRQLRLADSESYTATTAFLNGGQEQAFGDEERQLVPVSGDTAAYISDGPARLAAEFVKAIEGNTYDVIIAGLAQADRAAHTGSLETAVEAVQAIDAALRVMTEALLRHNGIAIIVASHGAAERTVDFTGIGGAHTKNPVPLLLVGKRFEGYSLGLPEPIGGDLSLLKPVGSLADVAPTLLSILNLPLPSGMTGRSFIT